MKCRGEKSKFRGLLPASSRGFWQLPIAFNQAQLIHENALTPISFYPFFWFPSLQTCFLLSPSSSTGLLVGILFYCLHVLLGKKAQLPLCIYILLGFHPNTNPVRSFFSDLSNPSKSKPPPPAAPTDQELCEVGLAPQMEPGCLKKRRRR
jgi:hypothetical protein